MNSICVDKESENICCNQTLDPISDHIITSSKVEVNESSAPMVSTSFVSNGCAQRDDTSVLNVLKTPANGLINCNNSQSTGSNSTCSTSSGVSGSHASNGDISSANSTALMSQTSPFPRLPGETVVFNGLTTEGVLIVTNFRLFMSYNASKDRLPISLALNMIESIELRELYYLYVYTKHIRSYILSFTSGDDTSVWFKRLTDICALESKLENLFCFKSFNATKSENKNGLVLVDNKQIRNCSEIVCKEFKRMAFDTVWRISDINKEFKLCSSYPRYLVVPQGVSDKDLESVADFRYSRRIPTVVWRHRKNGCVIARSSQPEVGWLGWRNSQDEHLLHSIVMSCSSVKTLNKKLLVLDARSYTAAVANRAKGGGCECPEYYSDCEVQFMSLANIHSIRKSFHSLRYICESPADQFNWLTLLDNSKWLHNISGLIKSALIVVNAIDLEERPVLVHCSDGWDRTPQIVALAELMLDPFYRTIDGFKVLVEREWIQFGHKFSDRCGAGATSEDINERCPVFLQWLDCVHQLVLQFPCSFEFNLQFLVKLIQHTYSCLFGTFICNNMRERLNLQVYERTHSVWTYFNTRRQQFLNYVFVPNEQVLRPSSKAKDIIFWSDVYMPLSSSVCGTYRQTCSSEWEQKDSIANDSTDGDICLNGLLKESDIECKQIDSELNASNNETNETESDMDTIASDKHHSLSKTRSCENIVLDINPSVLRTRHCSDPNLFCSLSIADQIDNERERGKCADILKYIRDLQTNRAVSREASDRDSNHLPSSRNSENGLLEDSDLGMSAHFSMLSTETLLNGNNTSYMEPTIQSCCENHNNSLTNLLTTSTSTTELSSSCVQNNDLTVQFDKLYNSVHFHKKKQSTTQTSSTPIQRQSSNDNNSNASNGYAKHTRTPSSGCPATPNDEQIFDAFPFDGSISQDIFDIDGHILLRDKVLVRLQQIIGQNRNEIDYLKRELYLARLALCQQLRYCNGINDENSVSNTSHSIEYTESPSMDSWVDVMPSLHQNTNGFALNTKCDKNHSFSSLDTEVNSSCEDQTNPSLSHL